MLHAIGKLADPLIQIQMRRNKAKVVPWIAGLCGVSPEHAYRIASESLANNLFRTLDDLLLLQPAYTPRPQDTRIDGREHLDAALARGNGVILMVGHFRANRTAIRYLAKHGYAALSVHNRRPANRFEGRLGKRFLQPRAIRLAKAANPDQVYVQDPDCSLRIMQRLRAGGLVVIQMDAHGRSRSVQRTFLGRSWRVSTAILEFVQRTNCAVVPLLCRGRSNTLRIGFDPMLALDTAGSHDAFVAVNLPRCLAHVEKQIVENPQEWRLWTHL
jgi:lauroyl/myristoyl acyltransferase